MKNKFDDWFVLSDGPIRWIAVIALVFIAIDVFPDDGFMALGIYGITCAGFGLALLCVLSKKSRLLPALLIALGVVSFVIWLLLAILKIS